jgi:hypothetical protein
MDFLCFQNSMENAVSTNPFVVYIEHSTEKGIHGSTVITWIKLPFEVLCKKHQEKGSQIYVHSWFCNLQLSSLPKTYPKIPPY